MGIEGKSFFLCIKAISYKEYEYSNRERAKKIPEELFASIDRAEIK